MHLYTQRTLRHTHARTHTETRMHARTRAHTHESRAFAGAVEAAADRCTREEGVCGDLQLARPVQAAGACVREHACVCARVCVCAHALCPWRAVWRITPSIGRRTLQMFARKFATNEIKLAALFCVSAWLAPINPDYGACACARVCACISFRSVRARACGTAARSVQPTSACTRSPGWPRSTAARGN